jgi:hypothetical protein
MSFLNSLYYTIGGNKKSMLKRTINPSDMLIPVGMAGFEPTTSSTPCWRDTWLRYIPKNFGYKYNNGN